MSSCTGKLNAKQLNTASRISARQWRNEPNDKPI